MDILRSDSDCKSAETDDSASDSDFKSTELRTDTLRSEYSVQLNLRVPGDPSGAKLNKPPRQKVFCSDSSTSDSEYQCMHGHS